MRKSLTVATTAAVLSIFTNSISAAEPAYYFEAGIGKSMLSDVKTKSYSGTASGLTFTNLRGTIEYDDPTYLGLEFGAIKPGGIPLRIGFGYSQFKAKFKKGTGSGTVTDGVRTVDFSIPVTRADLASVGLDFDNRIKIYSVNAYYDIETQGSLKPFVGAGIGFADIQNAKDKELTYSLHLGLNYELNKTAYVGARLGWYRTSGPTDKLAIDYEDVTTTTAGVVLGFKF